METIAGLAVGTLVLTAFFVAIKTFALWLRTRALPEILLSTYLFCATAIGYPIAIASSRIPPSEMWPLHLGSNLIMSVGFTCLLLFTLHVFRPDALWAKCAVGISIVIFAIAGVIYFRELTGPSPRAAADMLGLHLIGTTPIAFAYFWTTTEAWMYHRRLKLQQRLGLVQPAVANRVLLWGGMTLSAGTAVVVSVIGMLSGTFMTPAQVLTFSCLGLVHAFCLLFAFHPPGWYRRWVEQSASSPAEAS